MSKLSFVGFCIEKYAEHNSIPSNQVYELFKREGVLTLLQEDYGDLHGLGFEYMVYFIGEYLGFQPACKKTAHGTVRGLNLPQIIGLISEKYGWDEWKALDAFYTSGIGELFADDDTGLYGQSPLYIFSEFCDEMSYANERGEQ